MLLLPNPQEIDFWSYVLLLRARFEFNLSISIKKVCLHQFATGYHTFLKGLAASSHFFEVSESGLWDPPTQVSRSVTLVCCSHHWGNTFQKELSGKAVLSSWFFGGGGMTLQQIPTASNNQEENRIFRYPLVNEHSCLEYPHFQYETPLQSGSMFQPAMFVYQGGPIESDRSNP